MSKTKYMNLNEPQKQDIKKILNYCRINYGSNGISDEYEEEVASRLLQLFDKSVEEKLDLWKQDIENGFAPKCSFCGIKSRKVVGQLSKGKSSQENNSLPRNWMYYCQKCYDEGTELEREAMYG